MVCRQFTGSRMREDGGRIPPRASGSWPRYLAGITPWPIYSASPIATWLDEKTSGVAPRARLEWRNTTAVRYEQEKIGKTNTFTTVHEFLHTHRKCLQTGTAWSRIVPGKTKGRISEMKDSICCRWNLIPNQERLLDCPDLRAGLFFYSNFIHTFGSDLNI